MPECERVSLRRRIFAGAALAIFRCHPFGNDMIEDMQVRNLSATTS
jgi:hypothetical protein